MQLHDKKWLATCALGALGLAGASAAQAQVRVSPYINITVGAPLIQGEYGRIQFGTGTPLPPLHASRPVLVGRPAARATPMYLYVPASHRQNWGAHCYRYDACHHPVYFVNGGKAALYQPVRVVPERRIVVQRQPQYVPVDAHRHPEAPHVGKPRMEQPRHPAARQPQHPRPYEWEQRRGR